MDDLHSLSLTELHQRLTQQGVKISLSKLSEFLSLGDIRDQLQITGRGNRLIIHPHVVEVLTEFLPRFRADDVKGIAWHQAPNYLRSFLASGNTDLVPLAHRAEAITESRRGTDLTPLVELIGPNLASIAASLALHALTEKPILTRGEVCRLLSISPGALHAYGPRPAYRIGNSPRGDRWRLEDVKQWQPE